MSIHLLSGYAILQKREVVLLSDHSKCDQIFTNTYVHKRHTDSNIDLEDRCEKVKHSSKTDLKGQFFKRSEFYFLLVNVYSLVDLQGCMKS